MQRLFGAAQVHGHRWPAAWPVSGESLALLCGRVHRAAKTFCRDPGTKRWCKPHGLHLHVVSIAAVAAARARAAAARAAARAAAARTRAARTRAEAADSIWIFAGVTAARQ